MDAKEKELLREWPASEGGFADENIADCGRPFRDGGPGEGEAENLLKACARGDAPSL